MKPPERAESVLQDSETVASGAFGQKLGKKGAKKFKKNKKGGEDDDGDESEQKHRSNPAWQNYLRPLKRIPVVEAVLGRFFPMFGEMSL